MRRGESTYIGRDANGNPSGFTTLPTAHAGMKAKRYLARGAYCKERLANWREHQTHMRGVHPA